MKSDIASRDRQLDDLRNQLAVQSMALGLSVDNMQELASSELELKNSISRLRTENSELELR